MSKLDRAGRAGGVAAMARVPEREVRPPVEFEPEQRTRRGILREVVCEGHALHHIQRRPAPGMSRSGSGDVAKQ